MYHTENKHTLLASASVRRYIIRRMHSHRVHMKVLWGCYNALAVWDSYHPSPRSFGLATGMLIFVHEANFFDLRFYKSRNLREQCSLVILERGLNHLVGRHKNARELKKELESSANDCEGKSVLYISIRKARLCHELNFPSNSDLTPMFTPHFPTPTLLHTHSDFTPMLLRIFPHQPCSILLRCF